MSKTLTLNLNKGLIIEAVKADTYITGAIDKSTDVVKNAALAYNEQAGDDTYHERKLTRTLAGAVGSLEADLAEFVDSSVENSITDNLASAGADGAFNITVQVSDRYNSGLAYPIAQLSQEYIVNKMLYYWWQSIKPALAKDYLSFSGESLVNIRKCLAKKAPSTSDANYEDVTGEISGSSSGSNVRVITTADYDQENGYQVPKSNITGSYSQGRIVIEFSDPDVSFDAKVGDTTVFSASRSPYQVKAADIAALVAVTGNNVSLVPAGSPSDSNFFTIKVVS